MLAARRRLLTAGVAAVLTAGAARAAKPRPKVIHITARKFVFLPREITLRKGVPVTLELVSADVVMGFNAPDFKVRSDIIPGKVARLTFTPDKVGTFTFLCDIFCGDGHEGMSGTLKVVA